MSKKKHLFTKELRPMLYGFGDVENPRQDTIELVEDMVVEYISDLVTQAVRIAQTTSASSVPPSSTPQTKLRMDDLLFLLQHDPKKLARVEELLFMNEELKRARKAFEVDEEVGAGSREF